MEKFFEFETLELGRFVSSLKRLFKSLSAAQDYFKFKVLYFQTERSNSFATENILDSKHFAHP